MTTRPPSWEIDDLAADWAAKVDAGPLPPEEDVALNAWLAEDTRHLGAFGKARAIAVHTRRVRAFGPGFNLAKFSVAETSKPTRRLVMQLGGIAASVAAVGVAGVFALRRFDKRTYVTRLGETREVPLEDGSIITLNTNSEVAVNYTKQRREIQLLRGEALFDVAKNKTRPFVVEADGTQVRAVGTSFTVKLLPDQPVQVLVREGVVEIKRPAAPTTAPVRVAANTRAVAPADAPIAAKPVSVAEVNRELVWRVGRIAFEGETLQEAADTFARYSDIRIVIDDPEIRNETITGLFVSSDPIGFSKDVAISFKLHAEVSDGEVRLTR